MSAASVFVAAVHALRANKSFDTDAELASF